MNTINKLKTLDACRPALEWVAAQPDQTQQALWDTCHRADWMLWLYGKTNPDHKTCVRIALDCARLVQHLTTDKRVGECLDTVQRWLDGAATLEEVCKARLSAYAAGSCEDDIYPVAYAAINVAAAACCANDADAYATYAVDDAENADESEQLRKQCADIVRKHIPKAPNF